MGRPKKQDLPGMTGDGVEPQKKIPAIEKAAENYTDVRDKRMELTKKEVAAHDALLQEMRNAEIEEYLYDDQLVKVKPGKCKVKVKTVHDPSDMDDEDDED